jgi:ABC-type transport system involved in cytochrome c biogenesis permease subunit
MQKSSPLVPALQSNWLMMHVSMMLLSYGTLIMGSLLCILFLVISRYERY